MPGAIETCDFLFECSLIWLTKFSTPVRTARQHLSGHRNNSFALFCTFGVDCEFSFCLAFSFSLAMLNFSSCIFAYSSGCKFLRCLFRLFWALNPLKQMWHHTRGPDFGLSWSGSTFAFFEHAHRNRGNDALKLPSVSSLVEGNPLRVVHFLKLLKN